MTRKRIILVSVFAAIVGIGSWSVLKRFNGLSMTPEVARAQTSVNARFRLLNGDFMGDSATYTFQTPPEEKNYADDCIGCKQEVGNAVIFAEFGCPKKSEYLFKSNSDIGVIEKTPILDSSGAVVGEQRIVVFKDEEKIVGARLYWIEGQDFWAVQAPTVALTKALKDSEEYSSVRKKVASHQVIRSD